MPSDTSPTDFYKILEKAPEWSDVAVRNGPFFFGVFLVLVAVALILLNKNRYISSLFAVCGIALMVWASLLYSGIFGRIHAYLMRINNLTKDHQLVLTDSPPLLYMHNLMYDTAREAYHVDLATISPVKLNQGHTFKVIIKEKISVESPEGIPQDKFIK
jgi:hypothetical protein